MKLLYAPASPFARKVRVLAHETSLLEQIEMVDTAVLPTQANPLVCAENPLSKVPVLITNQGEALYDSRVICEYLADHAKNATWFPSHRLWRVLTLAALADGILEAALSIRYEQALRPENLQWGDWCSAQQSKIEQALITLNNADELPQPELNIAHIGIGCALGYLDFRLPDLDWRAAHPLLANFYSDFSARPSMRDSVPV